MKIICLLLSGFKYFSVAEQNSVLQKVMICFIQLFTPVDLPLFQAVVSLYGLQCLSEGHQVFIYPGVPAIQETPSLLQVACSICKTLTQ